MTLAVPAAHHLDAQAFAELIALAAGHDFVLVDTPPLLSVAETLALAARTDGLLLVVNSDSPLTSAEQAVQEAGRLGVQTLGVVLNRARAGRAGPYRGEGRALHLYFQALPCRSLHSCHRDGQRPRLSL